MTKVALRDVRLGRIGVEGYGWYLRHETHTDRGEEQRKDTHQAADSSAQPSEAREKSGEEGNGREEQAEQVEDPSEAPHVEELGARGVAAMVTDQLLGRVGRVRAPGLAEGRVGRGLAAVEVAVAAGVEIGPLRDWPGAGYA